MMIHLQSYLKLYHAYRIRLILEKIIQRLPWVGIIFLILSFYRLSLAWLVMAIYLCVMIWRAYRLEDQDQIVRALDQDLKQDALFEAGFQILREQDLKQDLKQDLSPQNPLKNNLNPKSIIQQEIQKILLEELWEKLCIFSQKQGKDLRNLTQWEACQWLILENHVPNFTKIPIERILLIFIFAFAQTTLRWEVDQLNWQDQSQDQIASQNQSKSQIQSNSQSKTLKYKKTQKPFQHKTSDQSDLINLKSKPKIADQNDSQAKDPNTKASNNTNTKNPNPNPKLVPKANPKSKSSENETEQSQSSLKAKQSQKPSSQSLGEITKVALPSKESNDLNPRSNQQSTQTPQVRESSEAKTSIKNFTIDRKITYYPIKQQASLKKYIQSNQQ